MSAPFKSSAVLMMLRVESALAGATVPSVVVNMVAVTSKDLS